MLLNIEVEVDILIVFIDIVFSFYIYSMKYILIAFVLLYIYICSGSYSWYTRWLYIEVWNVSYWYEYVGDVWFFKCYKVGNDFDC